MKEKITSSFRNFSGKNNKLILFFAALVAAGVLFLLIERFFGEPEEMIRNTLEETYSAVPVESETHAPREEFTYEQVLENRLAEFFSLVEGAGQVRVMVSPLCGGETVYATDVNETRLHTTEEDAQGGNRETRNYQTQEQTVIITDRQGIGTPLVLREVEPRISGIVIIAEGGDSPLVRDALTRAARAVLGLDAHMIQVLTMEVN